MPHKSKGIAYPSTPEHPKPKAKAKKKRMQGKK